MKKFLTVALAGVLAASMLFTGCSKKAESKVPDKLIVGTNAEFPPFEYMNDKKQPEGFDLSLIHIYIKIYCFVEKTCRND